MFPQREQHVLERLTYPQGWGPAFNMRNMSSVHILLAGLFNKYLISPPALDVPCCNKSSHDIRSIDAGAVGFSLSKQTVQQKPLPKDISAGLLAQKLPLQSSLQQKFYPGLIMILIGLNHSPCCRYSVLCSPQRSLQNVSLP